MNVFLAQDLSVYQLVLGVKASLQPLPLSPATLLSLVRAQIDLLIEQQIAATLLIKLPPGKIWQAEIQRYHQQLSGSCVIFTCHTEEDEGQSNSSLPLSPPSPFPHLQPHQQHSPRERKRRRRKKKGAGWQHVRGMENATV